MSQTDFHKVVIGRSELIHFTSFKIEDIPAKIDTGAYRSSVHASNIKIKNGILFCTILGDHPLFGSLAKEYSTNDFRLINVKSSFGHSEDRYEIMLRVKLGPKVFTTPFTLASRAERVYPILLGRKLLNDRFIVDTSKSSVNRKELKSMYNIELPNDNEIID